MQAIVLREKGGPEVLRMQEVPDPMPGPHDVLVEVRSTAVNRADLLQRMGRYPGPPMLHEIPGLEFAGTVVQTGERVIEHSIGDQVMGIANGGCYAELIAVHERQVMRVPNALPIQNAGAFPEVFITAWDALVRQGGLTSGRWALVHAGASGVGTAAIQIAKVIGSRIAVTASADKHHVCHALGADLVIDYNHEGFGERIADVTNGFGVDVILDVVGGNYLPRNVEALAMDGCIIQVGALAGAPVMFDVSTLMMKRATLIGTTLRARPLEQKISITREFATQMLPHVATDALSPVIDSRYPLAEVAAAHERMGVNANAGKLVLDVVV